MWVYVHVDIYVYGRHYVSLYVRVYMYMSACMSTRVRARMRLGRQHKRAQAINVRILTVVPLCYGKGGTLRSHPVVLCETAPFKPWVEWRRLTTAAVASGVTPGLNHKTSIPQNTIAECAWCGATERAGPRPKLLNQWNDHRATADIYRHGGTRGAHAYHSTNITDPKSATNVP